MTAFQHYQYLIPVVIMVAIYWMTFLKVEVEVPKDEKSSEDELAGDLPSSFKPYLNIPTIDLSPFYNSSSQTSDRLLLAKQIAFFSHELGSFYITVPTHLYNTSLHTSFLDHGRNLFTTDDAIKHKYSVNNKIARGFIEYGTESGSQTKYFENKEGFAYGYHRWQNSSTSDARLPANDMEGYNVWPPFINDEIFEYIFDMFVNISYTLLRAYSLAMYDSENVLNDEFNGGESISIVRLFHYFSNDGKYSDSKKTMNSNERKSRSNSKSKLQYLGSSPHTDWGLLTLVISENVDGLQLFYDGEWQTVRTEFNVGKIFVNCGDFMSMVSDGAFVSPLHRVLSPVDERISYVFFFYPNYNASIPDVEKSHKLSFFKNQSSDESVVIDKNMKFGEYIKEKWNQVSKK